MLIDVKLRKKQPSTQTLNALQQEGIIIEKEVKKKMDPYENSRMWDYYSPPKYND